MLTHELDALREIVDSAPQVPPTPPAPKQVDPFSVVGHESIRMFEGRKWTYKYDYASALWNTVKWHMLVCTMVFVVLAICAIFHSSLADGVDLFVISLEHGTVDFILQIIVALCTVLYVFTCLHMFGSLFLKKIMLWETLSFQSSAGAPPVNDMRADTVSQSEMKHKDPLSMVCISEVAYLVPYWDRISMKLSTRHTTYLTPSVELVAQVLTQPICSLNADEQTTFLRINQSVRSLHTVNYDRYKPLAVRAGKTSPGEEFPGQHSVFATHFIFKCEKQRLRHLNFPTPHQLSVGTHTGTG